MRRIKDGVILDKLKPPMIIAHAIVMSIYAKYGYYECITSGEDGKHMEGSKHYTGEALDFRIRNIENVKLHDIFLEIYDALGSGFDVVLEKTHIHVEIR